MPTTLHTTKNWDTLVENVLRLGFKSLSMDDIAGILGISKKTLYSRVENKDELVRLVTLDIMSLDRQAIGRYHEEAVDAIEEMKFIYDHFADKMRRVSHSCMHDLRKYYVEEWKLIDDFRRSIIFEAIGRNIRRGQGERIYRKDIDVDLLASLFRFVVTSMADDTELIAHYTKDQIFKEFMKYHLRGISTEQGHQKRKQHGFN